MKTFPSAVSAFVVLAVNTLSASATTYADAIADNYGGSEVDIASVVVNNDASMITFQINVNSAANIGANYFANYEIGIQMGSGAGGQTLINGTYGTGIPGAGNPYGNAVGISSGENFFIGSFLNGPSYSGGAQLYQYSSSTGWAQVGSTAPITEVPTGSPSTTFSFLLSDLGLSPGSTFRFDVWTSFGSPQGAYDALGNPSLPPGAAPYSGGTYDAATASGSALSSYTVVAVPEPATGALLAVGALLMGLRRLPARVRCE